MKILNSVRHKHWATAVLALTFAGMSAFGQTSGVGNIAGDVTDSTGAQVPNASIIIINTDTGVSRETKANGQGEYLAQFLQPGHYEVIVTAPGFGKVDRKNLVVNVGQIITVDAALSAGATSTEVQVTSDTPILDTDKTEVSQVIDQNLIGNLPVNTRNWSAFVLNTPNVTQDGTSGLVSFHGISGLYNQNYVDGANNNQMLFSEARGRASGAPYVYSIDSIKEFQAETSNYSVEFGQAAGGQVNAITKSGTNQIHGDAFYFLRYPALNALDPETKYSALYLTTNTAAQQFLLTQAVHQQNQFGGSVGGPIIKDRLFYFFTYDGFRKVGKALYYNTDTITQTPTPTGGGTVISPTQCPTTLTSALCANAISFILANTFAAPSRFQSQDLFFPRIDWHISKHNDMFVNFNRANYSSTYGYNQSPTFTASSPSTNASTVYHERFLVAGLTTQVSDRSVNQVHFQLGRDLETAGAYAPGPSVAMGAMTYGMNVGLPRVAEPDEKRAQITDVFSTTRGRHTFKFGGDANIVHEVMINLYTGGGTYSYSGTDSAKFTAWASDVYHGVAGNTDPYAGDHFSSVTQVHDVYNTAPGTAGKDDFYMKMFDGFAEDQWKLTPKFTLTAGVRYDIQITPPPVKTNTAYTSSNFALNGGAFSSYYSSTIKNTNRISPRVAFAWNPHPGTVVRAGYGIFSGLNQGSTYYAMRVENGVIQLNYNYGGCTSTCTATSAAATALQFPNLPFTPPGPDVSGQLRPAGAPAPVILGNGALSTQSFHGLDPNFVPPYAHEMEFGVEQQLPGKMSLTMNYVSTRGMRLPVFIDANLIGQTPHGLRSYNVVNGAGAVQQQLTVPVYLQSDRVIPALSSYNTGFSIANTWYNGLGLTLRRPFANGLEVLVNYTWAHATDTGQVEGTNGTFYGGDVPLDPNNIRRDNGNSDIDIRNRMVMSFVYQPRIFMDNFWVKQIVDGFQFSGAETASSGEPIYLGLGGSTIYNGLTTSYGAEGGIYGGAMSSGSGSATNGRPPQVGRNSIFAPGFNNVDFRVTRDIPIHENIKMQFIGEAFNLLNHRIVTGVNSTLSNFVTAGSTITGGTGTCAASAVPTGSTLQGCIAPNLATGASTFGTQSSTTSALYGARQLQVAAKLTF